MEVKQKIKEFETILIQELNNDEQYLGTKVALHTLLEVYRDQFRTELENIVFTKDEEIHKMD